MSTDNKQIYLELINRLIALNRMLTPLETEYEEFYKQAGKSGDVNLAALSVRMRGNIAHVQNNAYRMYLYLKKRLSMKNL